VQTITRTGWRQHVLRLRLPDGAVQEVNRDCFYQPELARQCAERLAAHLRLMPEYARDALAAAWTHEAYDDLDRDGIDPRGCFVQVWRFEPTVKLYDPISGLDEELPNPDATHGYVLYYEVPVDPALPPTPAEAAAVAHVSA
jgi:hypothetical protein